ncbi:hypothetical protein AbraIFM66950_003321 [Aspergillus brasiliensis]|nr:hypothetical protein AbraIFM66950_003321 [Aspergillus brasiliensis]
MNFFDWILTPFGKASTPEPQDHIWDPQTVTMQQPATPEAPSMDNSLSVLTSTKGNDFKFSRSEHARRW